ncbi:uncharacterized protein LOC128235069 isoform X2 [Mya arenaria]|uniref:uncharacterized protein LOC128235069 isoform X2 n=1 Tax=Mya arenaria TaxID=6604 RepID=UPI0022E7586C|nr:uncharacterized protein LOC128235069 isoform X2 [Mya arenaria]
MLGPSHKRRRSGHRCWDPVTRGGRDRDAVTQSQEVEVGTQMLGPSHKRRRSGHRCWDPVTRGGGQSTDAGTQSQEEEVRTQMLGPSHKRRRSEHRCWDPVTRGGGQSTDARTQSQEEMDRTLSQSQEADRQSQEHQPILLLTNSIDDSDIETSVWWRRLSCEASRSQGVLGVCFQHHPAADLAVITHQLLHNKVLAVQDWSVFWQQIRMNSNVKVMSSRLKFHVA